MAARCAAESAATIGMVGMTQRSDSMVSMPSPAAITSLSRTETDRVPEKVAHRPAWGIDRRLVAPGRIEPGAVRAGDVALEIGNSRDHCRPGFGRGVCLGTIVAARMESQAVDAMQVSDAASPQVGFHDRAGNRLRHGEQTPCRFR